MLRSTGTRPVPRWRCTRPLAGLPVDRLIMHDAPYLLEASEEATAYHTELHRLLAAGQPGEAVAAFLGQVGMPEEMITGMQASPSWPAMESVGYSLAYDSAAMGDRGRRRGAVRGPRDRCEVPTLILVGGEDFAFMIETAQALHARDRRLSVRASGGRRPRGRTRRRGAVSARVPGRRRLDSVTELVGVGDLGLAAVQPAMVAISSSLSSKSKTSMFSAIRPGSADFGMATSPAGRASGARPGGRLAVPVGDLGDHRIVAQLAAGCRRSGSRTR